MDWNGRENFMNEINKFLWDIIGGGEILVVKHHHSTLETMLSDRSTNT